MIVSQQSQDIITIDNGIHLAKQKPWYSSVSIEQFLGSSGSGGSVHKVADARSITPSNYAYFHGQKNVSSSFNVDELSSDNLPSSDTTTTKSRMRWTPELHEQFVDAVNKLGGSEKATPKAIQKVMKVEGLTIYHVKSHLQAARALSYLALHGDNISNNAAVGQEPGALEALVQLTHYPNEGFRQEAAGAFWNLSFDDRNRDSIASTGGVQALVRCLWSRPPCDGSSGSGAVWPRLHMFCEEEVKKRICNVSCERYVLRVQV